jgi:TP901 family phage tail tape measure protein
MADLEYTLSIGANLAANFKTVFSDSHTQIVNLGKDVRALQDTDVGKLGESFKRSGDKVATLNIRLQDAYAKLGRLETEASRAGGANADLARQIALVENEIKSLDGSLRRATNQHENLAASIRTESGSVETLMKDYKTLGAEMDRLNKRQQRLSANQAARDANQARRGQLRGELFDAVALGSTVFFPVKGAIEFESAMADAAKTIEGMRDDSGELTPMYHAMVREAKILGRELPISHSAIAGIMAKAGETGMTDAREIAEFTKTTAHMAVAFGISEENAASYMSAYRNSLGQSLDETRDMLDLVNYFGGRGAKEAVTADIVSSIGGFTKTAGLSSKNTVALGATLAAMGVDAGEAGTAIKNLTLAMSQGANASSTQDDALAAMGIDAVELANYLQEDATGAILHLLDAVNKLPEAERLATLTAFTGRGGASSIVSLAGNVDQLRKNFEVVGNASLYSASMQKEYENRSKTTANTLQIMQNKAAELGVTFGSVLLPPLNTVVDIIGAGATKVADLAEKYPHLTKVVGLAAAGLVTLAVVSKAGAYAFTFVRGGALTFQNALIRLGGIQRGSALATRRQTLANQSLARSYDRTARSANKAGAAAQGGARKFGAMGLAARAMPALLVFDVATSAIDSAYMKLMDLTGETQRLKDAGFESKGLVGDFNSVLDAQLTHNPYGFFEAKSTTDAHGNVWDSVPIAGLSGTMGMIKESQERWAGRESTVDVLDAQRTHNPYGLLGGENTTDAQGNVRDSVPIAGLSGTMDMMNESQRNLAAQETAALAEAVQRAEAALKMAQDVNSFQLNLPINIEKVSGLDPEEFRQRLSVLAGYMGEDFTQAVEEIVKSMQRNQERVAYGG